VILRGSCSVQQPVAKQLRNYGGGNNSTYILTIKH